ncbi:MAG: hypothetical protein JXA35_00530 [Deltaproteobacteria bacterium]|nr:hypothetical protein [Deltaproteobacteria bacterium]
MPLIKKICIFLFLALTIVLRVDLHADDISSIDNKDIIIYFDPLLERAARDLIDIYYEVKIEVETLLGWKYGLKPSVLLTRDRSQFLRTSQNDLIVAFAVPEKAIIVIDYSRMGHHIFRPETILKHEFCHLLLNYHINEKVLPRWLDEGVAQWISNSIGQIFIDPKKSLLNRAAFRGRFISLRSLKEGFPYDSESMQLAYEESKSFIEFILGKYGKDSILAILDYLKRGEDVDTAFLKVLPESLASLEKNWQNSLRKKINWLTYLSYHIYEIIFGLMGLISFIGFIRLMVKKRSYMKEEEEIAGNEFHDDDF